MHRVTQLSMPKLNEHLMCVLCGGYLIDATISVECLHAFCRSCITKYTEGCRTCPICDTLIHKTRPQLNLRPDKTLQDLVYKLVPGLFENEMTRRREFYETNPSPEETKSLNVDEERGRVKGHYDCATRVDEEKISLSLQIANRMPPYRNSSTFVNSGSEKMGSDRRYLLCPSSMPIGVLEKFIRTKFDLSPNLNVDFYHSDERLLEDVTLLDVASLYGWLRRSPLKLYFLVYDPKELTITQSVPETPQEALTLPLPSPPASPLPVPSSSSSASSASETVQPVISESLTNFFKIKKKKKKKKKDLQSIKITLKASSKALRKSRKSLKKKIRKELIKPAPHPPVDDTPLSSLRRSPSFDTDQTDQTDQYTFDSEYSDFSSAENTPQKLSVECVDTSQNGIRIRIRRSSGKDIGVPDKHVLCPKELPDPVTSDCERTPLVHSMDAILAKPCSVPEDVVQCKPESKDSVFTTSSPLPATSPPPREDRKQLTVLKVPRIISTGTHAHGDPPPKQPSPPKAKKPSPAKKRPFSQTNKTDCGPLPKVPRCKPKKEAVTHSAFVEPAPPPPPPPAPPHGSSTPQPRGLFSPNFHYPHSPIFSQYQYSPVSYGQGSSPRQVPLVYTALPPLDIPSPPSSSCAEPLELTTAEVRNRHIREATTSSSFAASTRRMS